MYICEQGYSSSVFCLPSDMPSRTGTDKPSHGLIAMAKSLCEDSGGFRLAFFIYALRSLTDPDVRLLVTYSDSGGVWWGPPAVQSLFSLQLLNLAGSVILLELVNLCCTGVLNVWFSFKHVRACMCVCVCVSVCNKGCHNIS